MKILITAALMTSREQLLNFLWIVHCGKIVYINSILKFKHFLVCILTFLWVYLIVSLL